MCEKTFNPLCPNRGVKVSAIALVGSAWNLALHYNRGYRCLMRRWFDAVSIF